MPAVVSILSSEKRKRDNGQRVTDPREDACMQDIAKVEHRYYNRVGFVLNARHFYINFLIDFNVLNIFINNEDTTYSKFLGGKSEIEFTYVIASAKNTLKFFTVQSFVSSLSFLFLAF